MRVIVDRFEGDYAVCEKDDRTMINIERKRLPVGVKDGDVLVLDAGSIRIDGSETARRRQQAKKLMDELWK